jgi:hypothetical protein
MILNLIRKPSYVCSICAQDFTRKYNANRHNQNIHFGKAEIVRFLEYLVGRVSGKYQPGDPLLYRNKNRKNGGGRSTVVHQNEYGDPLSVNGKSRPSAWNTSTYAAQSTEGVMSGNNAKVDNSIDNLNNPILYMYHLFQYADNRAKEFLQKQEIERNLKDIERMLQDFYPPHYVQSIIKDLINRYNSTTDYAGFDKELENFRSSIENMYLGLADRPKWNFH